MAIFPYPMPVCQHGACVTIGNFDGVHLGHQHLISLALQKSREQQCELDLLTFWPHPRDVIIGPGSHRPLTTPRERKKLLAACGVTNIWEIEFNRNLAALTADEFVSQYLLPLNIKSLVIGHDFSLGRQREGSARRLADIGNQYGFTVTQAKVFVINGTPVSSTRLREAIQQGQVETAATLLGRNYSLSGNVAHGRGRGAGLGFPTANLANIENMLPANGVYATCAIVAGQKHMAVTNIGFNPTFGNSEITVESFLLDTSANLYDCDLRLEFVSRLRDERKFVSPEALVEQIRKDAAAARSILQL